MTKGGGRGDGHFPQSLVYATDADDDQQAIFDKVIQPIGLRDFITQRRTVLDRQKSLNKDVIELRTPTGSKAFFF